MSPRKPTEEGAAPIGINGDTIYLMSGGTASAIFKFSCKEELSVKPSSGRHPNAGMSSSNAMGTTFEVTPRRRGTRQASAK